MRIVVTGAGGGLGRAFLAQVPPHHRAHAFTHAELDIGDREAVMGSIVPLAPEAILNLAAYTDVDACETQGPRAFRDNAIGPQNLALAAAVTGSVLLHVSTDYVFDGEKGRPYDEFDRVGPVSVYARSKLAGEELVRWSLREHIVVRTGHVFGSGSDFLSEAVARLRRGEPAGGVGDRIGTPTFVRHLAARLMPLVLAGRPGTYHLTGPEPTSWHDVLLRAKRIGGLAGDVREQRAADLALAAPRPRDCSLTSVLVEHIGVAPMPSLDDALAEFLDASR